MEPSTPVVAATYTNLYEAELARSVLEAEGITAALQSDDVGGLHPQLSMVRGVKLVVRQAELSAAQAVLDELDSPQN